MTACRLRCWMPIVAAASTVVSCAATAPAPAQESGAPPPSEQTEVAADKGLVNTLRWTTASEVENFGFDVYRSTSQNGPFERITPEPIPGAGTTDEPQRYVYVDDTIDPGVGYYYYLESISMQGVRERFSPTTYSPPKLTPERRN